MQCCKKESKPQTTFEIVIHNPDDEPKILEDVAVPKSGKRCSKITQIEHDAEMERQIAKDVDHFEKIDSKLRRIQTKWTSKVSIL